MKAAERREKIVEKLKKSGDAVSASSLAEVLGVSRQIIVGDVALLRAAGENITSTPRGYVIDKSGQVSGQFIKQVACVHDSEKMAEELRICVDQGCSVLDVIVDHPIYGQLTGQLRLRSRYDIEQFSQKCAAQEAHALSELTDGVHLHTLECPDESAYERVCAELKKAGFLYEE